MSVELGQVIGALVIPELFLQKAAGRFLLAESQCLSGTPFGLGAAGISIGYALLEHTLTGDLPRCNNFCFSDFLLHVAEVLI
ncbi:hypothetical protein D3C73_1471910 [compost metagenome]